MAEPGGIVVTAHQHPRHTHQHYHHHGCRDNSERICVPGPDALQMAEPGGLVVVTAYQHPHLSHHLHVHATTIFPAVIVTLSLSVCQDRVPYEWLSPEALW